jgi:hypothetical protein
LDATTGVGIPMGIVGGSSGGGPNNRSIALGSGGDAARGGESFGTSGDTM